MSQIDILMATYNGARFLPEQLASLENQTHKDWHLLIRDDGSSDATLQIVREWAGRVEQRVTILEDGRSGLGASLNFAALLEGSDAPYFAFCDQDDVWLPEKLEVMLATLLSAEAPSSQPVPALVYSDLRVVDQQLDMISDSYHDFSRRPKLREGRELRQVMLHNVVTGCASLGNAALRAQALPIPAAAVMHDWWLALVAAGTGRLIQMPQPTILYRQHGGNTLGANANDLISQIKYVLRSPALAIGRSRKLLADTQRQTRAFADRYADNLSQHERSILQEYSMLNEGGWPARKTFFLRNRILRDNIMKNLPYFILG
ncbi:glycosyltransferase family 2 protein [Aurantiacibacter rhizosphaerae]|uniref:Glycosyltransferase n=1 Tax=Aurantiacibacter rhizosphaerae TaxID=2691582 RepID=A0A844XI08_9SPHN|nr:glycosyltransferase family 2 protein [Aurantiacibacter rhizosphaerae]MWV29460.1 glycosyltransferase [Aurantiacibacter rhizosphaerae]